MSIKLPSKSPAEAIADLKALAAQPKPLLDTKQAAAYLDVSPAFLERDRWAGKRNGSGPLIPYVMIGNRAIKYRRIDLDAHIINNLHGAPSASDESKGGTDD